MTHYESKAMPDAEIARLVDRLAPLLSAKGIKKYSVPALVAAWANRCCVAVLKFDDYHGYEGERFADIAHHYMQPVKEVAK